MFERQKLLRNSSVAVSDESMPCLTQVDLARYFAPGTGAKAWVGVKVFKDNRNILAVHRWWACWAVRDQVNGQFLDHATLNAESMPVVTTYNGPHIIAYQYRISYQCRFAPLPNAYTCGVSAKLLTLIWRPSDGLFYLFYDGYVTQTSVFLVLSFRFSITWTDISDIQNWSMGIVEFNDSRGGIWGE